MPASLVMGRAGGSMVLARFRRPMVLCRLVFGSFVLVPGPFVLGLGLFILVILVLFILSTLMFTFVSSLH